MRIIYLKKKNYDDFVKWYKLNSALLTTFIDLPQVKNDSELREATESEFINYHLILSETLFSIGEYQEAEREINTAI